MSAVWAYLLAEPRSGVGEGAEEKGWTRAGLRMSMRGKRRLQAW